MKVHDLKNAILQLALQGKLVPQNQKDDPAINLLKRIKTEKVRRFVSGLIAIPKGRRYSVGPFLLPC